ncbi:MAG: hypothetical protein H0U59_07160 [Gemmatimonadaceae bacterium]|nr:hypothetical protein [Gemmatimonadaceae bacterium]
MSGYIMPTPSDTRTYGPEQVRRHRLRRALNELMADPGYHLSVSDGKLMVGPPHAITPEARQFISTYRADLIQHLQWLGE